MVAALAELTDDGGVVSIVAKNQACLAVRPALAGRWAEALSALDATRQANGLEVARLTSMFVVKTPLRPDDP